MYIRVVRFSTFLEFNALPHHNLWRKYNRAQKTIETVILAKFHFSPEPQSFSKMSKNRQNFDDFNVTFSEWASDIQYQNKYKTT